MALLADYTNLTDAALSAAELNSRFQALWNLLGFTTQGQGTLDYLNSSLATNPYRNTQIADTSMVLGTAVSGTSDQTVTKRTLFDAGSFRHNTTASNRETIANADGSTIGARTFWKRWVPAALLTIATLLPGSIVVPGDVISIVVDNRGSAGAFTLISTGAVGFVNEFHLRGGTSTSIVAGSIGVVGTYVYGDLIGLGFNQWWEI